MESAKASGLERKGLLRAKTVVEGEKRGRLV